MSDDKRIQEAAATSIQSDINEEVTGGGGSTGALGMLIMLGTSSGMVPAWWSQARDSYLRKFIRKSDHLAGALYNFSIKLRTIPLRVEARNESIKSHVQLAQAYEHEIQATYDFGRGFDSLFSKWIEDYHTQDNGAFLEVIADGQKDQPIRGRVLSVGHLDSARCTRTGNYEFPVVYRSKDGKLYKLHRTRVVASSQRPSPISGMNDVGYCTISSILNTSQSLIDNLTYKQERVGSRPAEAFIITGGGLDPEDISKAMSLQRARDDNSQLQKYSRTVMAGARNIQDPKFDIYRLNEMPEWFNERESTILGMAVIAMGFGIDARELFPAMESGATKADAIISHIKQRGKGPGHVLSVMEKILNMYVLPRFLKAKFDYQDDSEDRQRAEITSIRAQSRERDINNRITTRRVERQKMLHEEEITQSMFEDLELEDGRLPNGVDVTTLFESDDKDYANWLSGTTDSNWEDKKKELNKFLINSKSEEMIIKARRALAAIRFRYEKNEMIEVDEDGKPIGTDDSYEQERYGRKLPKKPITAEDETQNYQEGDAK